MWLNFVFILLNSTLCTLCLYNLYIKNNWKEVYIVFSLLVVINLIFLVSNLIEFYILFELTLPLLFILISLYGSKYRIKASYYIFIYTLFGSLFLLIGIILYSFYLNNINLSIISNLEISSKYIELLLYGLILIGFIIKIPQFPFHIWLSFAHTEAPASGSIILAGIVLKLSIYGIFVILINLLPNAHEIYSFYMIWLGIFTLFYITGITMIQNDTKLIIAYSSIAHMSIVVLGIYSNSIYGFIGSIILSIAHGFASPGLFVISGDYIYKLYHTRMLSIVRGLSQYSPILAVFLFLFSLCNISFPFTLNFLGEFSCLIGLKDLKMELLLSSFTILFSSLITFNLLTKVNYRDSIYINPSSIITRTQFNILLSLFTPLLILGLINESLFLNLGYNLLDFML